MYHNTQNKPPKRPIIGHQTEEKEMVEILNNPDMQMAAQAADSKSGLRAKLADLLMSTKTWSDMTANERKCCVHHVVSQSMTEDELREKLTEELGVGYCAIEWGDVDPNDKTSREAQMIVKALGGMISMSGAMVMIMTAEEQF
jgi:hypothetical protein